MEQHALRLARSGAPWREGISWWLIAIEGAALGALGIYVLADPSGSRDIIRQLIAAVLLVHSAVHVISVFRSPLQPTDRFKLLRAGIGLSVGAIVILAPLRDYLADNAARSILGFGLLAYGLVAVAETVSAREEGASRTEGLLAPLLTVVVAVILLAGSDDDTGGIRLLGGIALAAGILLLGYAILLNRGRIPWRRAPQVAS